MPDQYEKESVGPQIREADTRNGKKYPKADKPDSLTKCPCNVPENEATAQLESPGDLFESKVKSTFKKKIINQNEVLKDATGKVIGEIDFETSEALVEVGISLGGKTSQLHRLASLAKKRAKRLDVIYGPRTSPGTLKGLKESLKKKFGNRVQFIPHQ